jgi:hypothetical protein
MGVSAWVDHQRIEASQGVLDRIDEDPLVIRLDDFELNVMPGGELLETVVNLLKGHRAIDCRLAPTQQIEVRAMQDQNTRHRRLPYAYDRALSAIDKSSPLARRARTRAGHRQIKDRRVASPKSPAS